jgi:uncharacterized protein (TIGR00266 family)
MSELEYEIEGSDLQMLNIKLSAQQGIVSEPGTMVKSHPSMTMETAARGGLFSSLARAVAGTGLFLTTFSNQEGVAHEISFAAPYPGKIMPIKLNEHNNTLIVQSHCFLCANKSTEITVCSTRKLSTGLFGGAGFILLKLQGQETCFLHGGGFIKKIELQAGESINVEAGCLLAYESTVDFSLERIRGIRNMLFGGEGIFLAVLSGPGTIYIQSLPLARLAHTIGHLLPNKS